MRIVFMGTPDLAATILEYCASQHEVVAAYTRPDAVRGRGKKLVSSPVKMKALELGIPVTELTSFKNEADVEHLRALQPDCICVAAFGVLLPKSVLDIPPLGCLNVHASLLPRWRGAAPIARSILAGDEETGVCIMRMEEGLDTGAYCVCRSVEIGDMNSERLTLELAELGAQALLTALNHIEAGCDHWVEQPEDGVVYAHKIEKGELNIAPNLDAADAWRCVRASDESHPARALIANKSVTVKAVALPLTPDECFETDFENNFEGASAAVEVPQLTAGQVAFFQKRLYLGFENGVLEVLELQPDGKKPMDARAFAAGIQGIKQNGASWSGICAS